MLKKFRSKKAQAMVELAILGPLLLAAVGYVVTYVCKLNNDQYELMEAFRKALAKAHDTNQIVSYGTYDDRRMASVSEPITGQKTPSSGSAAVSWSIPSVQGCGQDPQGTTYVRVNLPEYNLGPASGGVEPMYVTFKGSGVNINSVNGVTNSTHTAGAAELMVYEINKKKYIQGRGTVGSRAYGGTVQ